MKLSTLVQLSETSMTDADTVAAAAAIVIDNAADKCYRVNGEVDKDGIDDFIDDEVQKFAKLVRAKAKELNKLNK